MCSHIPLASPLNSCAARMELESEVEQHYRTHASEASRLGSADVAAEYQSIKAEVEVKTAKIASECEVLLAQLQVRGVWGTS